MAKLLQVRKYPGDFDLQCNFYDNGEIVMIDNRGNEWHEAYFRIPNWFERWHPEIVADLKANPIAGFPVPIVVNEETDAAWSIYFRGPNGWLMRLDPRKIAAQAQELGLD